MCSINPSGGAGKRCPDCGQTRPLEDFCKHKGQPDGRAVYCRTCHNARNRASKERNGGSRHYHLRQRYGIGAADVAAMVAAQGGLCAVCRRKPAVQVDHDHASNRVRGILCDGCNGLLGAFYDREDLILRAIGYLQRWI